DGNAFPAGLEAPPKAPDGNDGLAHGRYGIRTGPPPKPPGPPPSPPMPPGPPCPPPLRAPAPPAVALTTCSPSARPETISAVILLFSPTSMRRGCTCWLAGS